MHEASLARLSCALVALTLLAAPFASLAETVTLVLHDIEWQRGQLLPAYCDVPVDLGSNVATILAELAELCELVTGTARRVLDQEQIRYAGLEITGCWANVGFPGSRHRTHAHPNNYLSGVYYVKAPPGGNTINFLDPRPQSAGMVPPSRTVSICT